MNEALIRFTKSSYAADEVAVALRSIRNDENEIKIQVELEGFPGEHKWTWEPIEQVREDLSGMLRFFPDHSSEAN